MVHIWYIPAQSPTENQPATGQWQPSRLNYKKNNNTNEIENSFYPTAT
ncbi:hypothetical protein GCM10025794_34640 [Massilia kyonggiensis]